MAGGQWGQIVSELVVNLDFLAVDHKSDEHLALLYVLCKEGWAKSAIDDYQTQMEALNHYVMAATILSDKMIDKIKTELRRVAPEARIEVDAIRTVLESEVIKRELLEGDKAEAARKTVAKAAKVMLRETISE